jgi:uncharacterized protein
MNRVLSLLVAILIVVASDRAQHSLQRYQPVNFSNVQITDTFWKSKMDKVATVSLPACIYQTEVKTPRIRNFEKVIRHKGEKHEGIYYDDSDVYKALEAMAYSINTHPDSNLEATADRWIDIIAAAQMPDGYLNTYYELGDISKRWTELEKHEDYIAGHLIEAAVAHYNATGKRKLLDVAIKLADHIDSTLRLQNRQWFSGHQEIELALMKLYRCTENERYVKLADWYLQQRGHRYYPYGKNWFTPEYWQDMLPVKEQTKITGHAVRAMYMYSGAADVAAVTGDSGYINAMQAVWQDVVYRNMYLTGGIGSSGDNEGFSKGYDLPNDLAYCETCASVGMVFWNSRMSQLTGNSIYMDVLERSLYNAAIDGLSLSGDRFFYDNPLASNGQNQRSEWFGTACCPSNICRLVASLGNYIYGKSDNGIWINLFIGSKSTIPVGKTNVNVDMQTRYPWDGNVRINVNPDKAATFELRLRIPGWAEGHPVPGDLYEFVNFKSQPITVLVNGNKVSAKTENGYLILNRTWKSGDVIEYNMPMQINRVGANPTVKADTLRVALQRGPLVYCVEGADGKGKAWDFILPDTATFSTHPFAVNDEHVVAIDGSVERMIISNDGHNVQVAKSTITAIPYYVWANRGANEMQVWLPKVINEVKINN